MTVVPKVRTQWFKADILMAPSPSVAHLEARLDRQDARELRHFWTVVGLIVALIAGGAEMRFNFGERLARLETKAEMQTSVLTRLDNTADELEERLRALERVQRNGS